MHESAVAFRRRTRMTRRRLRDDAISDEIAGRPGSGAQIIRKGRKVGAGTTRNEIVTAASFRI